MERPPRRLEVFWRLDRAGLAGELRRAAPRTFRAIEEATLLDEYQAIARQAREVVADIVGLELEIQRMVFDAYGLTTDDVPLIRSTAPPRDPLTLVEAEARLLGLPSELPPSRADQ